MFNAVRTLFTNDASKAEFKQFLQQYHQRIEAKHDIGYLGLTKALHAVSEELGYKNWQTLDALSDSAASTPSTGFYRLNFREVPVESEDTGTDKVYPTAAAAVHFLWNYVQNRIMSCCSDAFLAEFDWFRSDYGFMEDMDDMEQEDIEACTRRLLLCLSFEDACEAINWYFGFANDNIIVADFNLIYHEGAHDEDGRHVDIESSYDTQFDHPLLGLAGIRVDKGKVFGDEELYTIAEGPYLTKGLNFKSHHRALSAATEDMLALIEKKHGKVAFFARMLADQKELARSVAPE